MNTSWKVAPLTIPLVFTSCSSIRLQATRTAVIPDGQAQVAQLLPRHDGLQFCAHITARDLAPRGARNVFVHSISAYITTRDPTQPALFAIRGRYPGWDTPGTTIYNQTFTNTNTVWLEILHEFHLGVACIEIYGRGLLPSRYAAFRNKLLISYTYLPVHGPGYMTQKLISLHWGPYLPQYSPRVRPQH